MIHHLPPRWGSILRSLIGGLLLTIALIGQAIVLLVGAADAWIAARLGTRRITHILSDFASLVWTMWRKEIRR